MRHLISNRQSKKEKTVMPSDIQTKSGIYIHIPFCTSKCLYCDFFSTPAKNEKVRYDYEKAVIRELKRRLPELEGTVLRSVYIGGGSPSLMDALFFSRISDIVSSSGTPVQNIEYTVEINPHDIGTDWIRELKDTGVNRISAGIQAFDDTVLKEMGRRTTIEDMKRTLPVLADGFKNLSIDMIYGIGRGRDIATELSQIFDIAAPVHFSAYQYTPPEKKDAPAPLDEETSASQEKIFMETLLEKGFHRYEVSNYSKEGYESIHNTIYWEMGTWLGIGAGARSFNSIKREHSFYDENTSSFISGEGLSRYFPSLREQIEEFLLMGLRMTKGIEINRMEYHFGTALDKMIADTGLNNLIDEGLLEKNNGRIFCTEKGMNFLNTVLLKLFESIKV